MGDQLQLRLLGRLDRPSIVPQQAALTVLEEIQAQALLVEGMAA